MKFGLLSDDSDAVRGFLNLLLGQNTLSQSEDISVAEVYAKVVKELAPFCALEFITAFLMGIISGRLVVFMNLDTKWKIFRYSNYWYYLFSSRVNLIEKYRINDQRDKSQRASSKDFLFCVVDVLVNTNEGRKLYSGTLVDYFLDDERKNELSKVVLREPYRYSTRDNKNEMELKGIPGSFFILDCSELLNINITYIYNKEKKAKKIPKVLEFLFYLTPIISLLTLPFFLIPNKILDSSTYLSIMDQNLFLRFLAWVIFVSLIQLVNPLFNNKNNVLVWKSIGGYLRQVFIISILSLVYFYFSR